MKMNFKKGLIFFFIMLIVFAVLPLKSFAEDIDINAASELKGTCKMGCICPVKIDIESSGKNIKGILNLSLGEDTYSHSAEILSGMKKTYTFMVPVKKQIKDMKVTLVQKGETILSKTFPIDVRDSDSVFIGLLSDDADEYNFLKDMKIAPVETNNNEVIDLKQAEMSYAVLKNINFIIIDDFDYENLSGDYKDNIDKWLKNGGIIFLGSGKYKNKNFTGPFKDVKDITYAGSGSIIPVNFELSDKSNINKFNEIVLQDLNYNELNSLIQKSDIQKKINKIEILSGSANSTLKTDKNITILLIILLILYMTVLIIMVLFRKKKFFMWFSAVLIFSAAFYSVYLICGTGNEKLSDASINRYFCNACESDSVINIYPYKKDIKLNLNNSIIASDIGTQDAVFDASDNFIKYNALKETSYMYNASINNSDNISKSKLTLTGEYIKGEIKNELLYDLDNSFLIAGDTFIKIGSLKSGESVKMNYQMDQKLKGKGDFEYINFIQNQINDEYEKKFIECYPMLRNSSDFKCELVGFTKRKIPMDVNDKNAKVSSLNMEVIPVELNFADDNDEIPEGIIKPSVKIDAQNDNVREYTFKKDEDVKIYYNLPKDMKIKKIEMENTFKDGNFKLEVFNYTFNRWQAMDSLSISNTDFLNKNHILCVRIKGDGRFVIPDIILKVH